MTPSLPSLRDAFVLNSETGILTRSRNGTVAGFDNGNGYRRLSFGRRKYYCHQVVWALTHGAWPNGKIDHIDGNPLNNCPSNLRLTNHNGNAQNSRQRSHSKQPYKGVRKTRTGKWAARIRSDNRNFHLGTFDTPEVAHAAYQRAAIRLHGEFRRFA